MVNATKPSRARFRRIVDGGIRTVMGVDFSGAAQSGKTAWIAELELREGLSSETDLPSFRLISLHPIGKLAGDDDRGTVNRYLVDRISSQGQTLWGCDFPFGLPVDLPIGGWLEQLSHASAFVGSAKEFGHRLVEMTEHACGKKHVRRRTDCETQTPFDCYHYRIIYQTFHGMRDVLTPIATLPSVTVLPFQYEKAISRRRNSVVVEACPSSTLKRLGLPHQRYKQSAGKPPSEIHKQTRRTIMKSVLRSVEISPHRRRVIMNDPGGDALDAVLAGWGAWFGFTGADHHKIATHNRYPLEGYVYC